MTSRQRQLLLDEIVRSTRLMVAGSVLANHRMAEMLEINATDLQVLNTIDLFGALTPRDLSQKTGLSTPGVTVALDRLERARRVERIPNPVDRRSVLVRSLVKSAHPAYQTVEKTMRGTLSRYSTGELGIILDFLVKAIPVEPKAK